VPPTTPLPHEAVPAAEIMHEIIILPTGDWSRVSDTDPEHKFHRLTIGQDTFEGLCNGGLTPAEVLGFAGIELDPLVRVPKELPPEHRAHLKNMAQDCIPESSNSPRMMTAILPDGTVYELEYTFGAGWNCWVYPEGHKGNDNSAILTQVLFDAKPEPKKPELYHEQHGDWHIYAMREGHDMDEPVPLAQAGFFRVLHNDDWQANCKTLAIARTLTGMK
jgi:hypothetical protein